MIPRSSSDVLFIKTSTRIITRCSRSRPMMEHLRLNDKPAPRRHLHKTKQENSFDSPLKPESSRQEHRALLGPVFLSGRLLLDEAKITARSQHRWQQPPSNSCPHFRPPLLLRLGVNSSRPSPAQQPALVPFRTPWPRPRLTIRRSPPPLPPDRPHRAGTETGPDTCRRSRVGKSRSELPRSYRQYVVRRKKRVGWASRGT